MRLKVLIFVLLTNHYFKCKAIKLTFNQGERKHFISYFTPLNPINITCEAGENFSISNSKIFYNNKEIPNYKIRREDNSLILIIPNFVPDTPESAFECVFNNKITKKTKSLKVIFYKMCTINQCLNGGTCFVQGNVEFCQCPYEYHGTLCENFVPDLNIFGIIYKNGMQLPASTIATLFLLLLVLIGVGIFWYVTTYTKWGVKKIHQFYLKRHKAIVLNNEDENVKNINETIIMDESNYDLAINNKHFEEGTPFIDDPGQNYDNLNFKVCHSMSQMK
uniref:EGF-like domain-containing protein n=1 Tax=Parastrongyloides trichosuri TaxID=131310 RepID=A0A0N5A0G3_PARTI